MMALLAGWGVGERFAKFLAWVALPVLLLVGFYLLLDAYGDSRYRAGVTATDTRWEEAGRKLEAKAAESATKADKASVVRVLDYNAKVADEKERLDATAVDGTSPLDVLFNTGGVR